MRRPRPFAKPRIVAVLAGLLVAGLVAAACVPPAPEPAPTTTTVPSGVTPGAFRFVADGGTIEFGNVSLDVATLAPTFEGSIDADGAITIPASAVVFSEHSVTAEFQLEENQPPSTETVWMSLIATDDARGVLDPATGAVTLEVPLRIGINPFGPGSLQPLVLNNCRLGTSSNPLVLRLTTEVTDPPAPNEPVSGVRYDPGDASLTLVDNAFEMPGAAQCGLFGLANPIVNDAYGTPSPAGTNSAVLTGVLDLPGPPAAN